jgi:1,4-dihydroxy-2-naphthoate octaprenyltransferase
MFTGGTRVLVDQALGFKEVRRGIFTVLILILCSSLMLLQYSPQSSRLPLGLLIAVGLLLGLGYTVPPLQFAYRGLGEIVVGLTHSPYVILCGFIFQGGGWHDPLPWFLSVPLFLAILAAIILAGIPDRRADEAVNKKTVSVLLGPRVATRLAIACAAGAWLSALVLIYLKIFTAPGIVWYLLVLPHGALLVYFVFRLSRSDRLQGRIDREMALALSYVIWFGVLPLYALW